MIRYKSNVDLCRFLFLIENKTIEEVNLQRLSAKKAFVNTTVTLK